MRGILREIEPKQGQRTDLPDGGDRKSRSQAAQDAGLSERQKVTALRVANAPQEEFDAAVEAEEPVTVTKLADRGKIGEGDAGRADCRSRKDW